MWYFRLAKSWRIIPFLHTRRKTRGVTLKLPMPISELVTSTPACTGSPTFPTDFYDRLRVGAVDLRDPYDPSHSLFETTVNALLQARPLDERRLVRTLDSNARAFLSDRYRPLDHHEILERVLPALDSEVAADLAIWRWETGVSA